MATIHFNTFGKDEWRNSSPFYYTCYYVDKNADLRGMNSYELLLHYMRYGIGERRIANVDMKVPNM